MKSIFLLLLLALVSCSEKPAADDGKKDVVVTQSDIDHYLKEHPTQSPVAAKQELELRAKRAQAALDAGLGEDPVVRAEVARVLASRLRETQLFPKLKEAADTPISEGRLREIYEGQRERFISAEKRQVAVLWLNPGQDPSRAVKYSDKLKGALEWFQENEAPPAEGFGVLSIDHSEHAPSRYKGGVVGWFQNDGGATAWEKAVVEIAYSLKNVGEVSPVVKNAEGIFLVRLMGLTASKERGFEEVRGELERQERSRITAGIEADFEKAILEGTPALPNRQ